MATLDVDTVLQQAADTIHAKETHVAELEEKESWVVKRERLVEQALEDGDHAALARVAALPGGFGSEEMRKRVWPVLLRIQRFFPTTIPSPSAESEDQAGEGRTSEQAEGPSDEADTSRGEAPVPSQTLSSSSATFSDGTQVDVEPLPHPDEGQVLLDTKRSFVTYPKDLHPQTKKLMQADLQELIVHVLRLYPTLGYFQGFHDIMSVLYLTFIPRPLPPPARSRSTSRRNRVRSGSTSPLTRTLTPASGSATPAVVEALDGQPIEDEHTREGDRGRQEGGAEPAVDRDTPEWRTLRQCADVVSLCRVRDAMGKGMEPMMGLLKILQRLLRAADPDLYRFSSTISPVPTLPFFALSWILCLFSHDIDGLEPVQRMFDFLLARNPISAIYLAVAILIAKKDQMGILAKELGPEGEDDPSLLHPLFSRLPPLYSDTPDSSSPPPSVEVNQNTADDDPNPYDPIPLSRVFALTDDLLARYPWDGEDIRGKEIMGEGSVVLTYTLEEEKGQWTLQEAERMVDKDVIRPGAAEPDEEEEEEDQPAPTVPLRRRLHGPRNRLGTAVAIGVLAVGIGIAIYGRSGTRTGWTGWWKMVIQSWIGKGGLDVLHSWKTVGGFVHELVGEIL